MGVVGDKDVQFAEASFVEQKAEPLARRHSAPGMLTRDLVLASTQIGLGLHLAQFGNPWVLGLLAQYPPTFLSYRFVSVRQFCRLPGSGVARVVIRLYLAQEQQGSAEGAY